MDKNQIIGIVIIAVILIGYSIYTKPTQEEIETARQEKITRDVPLISKKSAGRN